MGNCKKIVYLCLFFFQKFLIFRGCKIIGKYLLIFFCYDCVLYYYFVELCIFVK